MPKSTECQARIGNHWEQMNIDEALAKRGQFV